jgi:hypothetical protein
MIVSLINPDDNVSDRPSRDVGNDFVAIAIEESIPERVSRNSISDVETG